MTDHHPEITTEVAGAVEDFWHASISGDARVMTDTKARFGLALVNLIDERVAVALMRIGKPRPPAENAP